MWPFLLFLEKKIQKRFALILCHFNMLATVPQYSISGNDWIFNVLFCCVSDCSHYPDFVSCPVFENECIPEFYLCDGSPDCLNGTDERNCRKFYLDLFG